MRGCVSSSLAEFARAYEPVVCGCGTVLDLYARRCSTAPEVLHWRSPLMMASTERGEALRLVDHHGGVLHTCRSRRWAPGARLRLASEVAR